MHHLCGDPERLALAQPLVTDDDFGDLVTGKLAARLQPSRQVTLRGAVSTGFRAPGLGQIYWGKVVTNFIGGEAGKSACSR